MPSSTCSGLVLIKESSAVIYGSHSQAFAMRVSTFPILLSAFTFPGNAAPPMPTTPAFRIVSKISSAVSGNSLGSAVVSWKSFSITTARDCPKVGCGLCSMATTVPETDACTGTHKPSPSPIFCPHNTWSPTLTSGVQGFPICCCIGITTCLGEMVRKLVSFVDISLLYLGWIPPKNKFFISSSSIMFLLIF